MHIFNHDGNDLMLFDIKIQIMEKLPPLPIFVAVEVGVTAA